MLLADRCDCDGGDWAETRTMLTDRCGGGKATFVNGHFPLEGARLLLGPHLIICLHTQGR